MKFEKYHTNESIVKKNIPTEIKTQIPIFEELDEDLSEGYCVIGGAAKSLAFAVLHKNSPIPKIRDVDLATFGYPEGQTYEYLSEKYSPDDFAHGHGAQELVSVEDYMNSRDFSMSQVMYQNGNLILTKRAIDDIRRGIIRPVEDRYGYFDTDTNNDISPRLALKAVLQKTVLQEAIPDIKIEKGITCDEFDPDFNNYSAFQLALCIQKAFEYGEEIPQKFIKEIVASELFNPDVFSIFLDENEDITPIYEIMDRISERLKFPFDYRGQALEHYNNAKFRESFWKDTNEAQFDRDMEYLEDMISKQNGTYKGNYRLN
ncbi:MAG: hypothetical protein WAU07_04550 [Microgenomates group bacterium]